MSEAKHTKGPWRVVAHSWSQVSVYAGERGSECICRLCVDEDEATEESQGALEAQMRARATAIAALPELLDALARAKAWIELQMYEKGWPQERVENPPAGSHLDGINAALAKATGAA